MLGSHDECFSAVVEYFAVVECIGIGTIIHTLSLDV